MFRFLPEQASEIAPDVDWIHNLVTDLSVFFTVAIVGSMLYFAIRYRRRDGVDHETPQILGSHLLEIIWTVVPTLVSIYIAYYGVKIFRELRAVPKDALTIQVTAQKWNWSFEYDNGKKTTGEATIPVNTPVKFVLQSKDVLHSFFVPAMRVKSDAVPGQFTYVTFKPVRTGEFQVFCTEYCGKDHSAMLAKLHVLPRVEYEKWLADDSARLQEMKMNPVDRGHKLYMEKGCNSCHSLDGARGVGPTWLNVFGRKGKFTDGTEYEVNEQYIQESILSPNKHIVEGYTPNIMPSFEGQLTIEQISSLATYMRTLKGTAAVAPTPVPVSAADLSKLTPAERGKKIYQERLCVTCHSLDGKKIVGPSFKDFYGTPQKLTDGTTVNADDAYIKESIYKPTAKVVEGYAPAMPPYEGQLTDSDVADVIEFLKTVK